MRLTSRREQLVNIVKVKYAKASDIVADDGMFGRQPIALIRRLVRRGGRLSHALRHQAKYNAGLD